MVIRTKDIIRGRGRYQDLSYNEWLSIIEQATPSELQRLLQFSHYISTIYARGTQFTSTIGIHFDLARRKIGYADITIDQPQKTVMWQNFFPLDVVPYLRRRGFGTLTYAAANLALDIRERVPHDYRVRNENPSDLMRLFLKAQCLDTENEESETFGNYLKRSLEYAKTKGFDIGSEGKRLCYPTLWKP